MPNHEQRYTGALGPVELASDVLVVDQIIQGVNAAVQLVNKSLDALDRGDHERAAAWLDRAERLLPDPDAVPADHRDGVVEALAAVARMRGLAGGRPLAE